MVPEAREVRNQIIVDFLAWRNIADYEALARQIGPAKFGLVRQRMLFGQNDEDPLAPQMFRLTAIPGSRSRHECNVQIQLPDGGDVLGRISITDFHPDVRMKLPELAQEVEQKTRCERRKYPDLETPLLNPADCRHLARANVNLAKSTSGASEEFLAGDGQADPGRMTQEKRCAKLVLQIADLTADRGFVDGERDSSLAKTSMVRCREEASQLLQADR